MQKKLAGTAILIFILLGNCIAQYAIENINASLTKNANMVVRLHEKNVTIKNAGSAVVKEKYVFSILNAGGEKFAKFYSSYDKLVKVNDIEGRLYNSAGAKIQSIKKGELKDYSGTSESNLADDNRIKYHNFNHNIYPYTVEYESTTEYDGLFYLPGWVPVLDEYVAVENSSFSVTTDADYILRYKAFSIADEAVITKNKNSVTYKWQLNKYAAIKEEVYAPSWLEITPTVLVAPSNFEMQRYKGSMNNWQEFGRFIYQLNAGRDVLPAAIKQKVHSLTDAVKDPQEKVKILYRYLQQNTRYISIQLGIGGWQTLDANFVASNGYGDCKALTNYMFALLKEAGIKSHYTLIRAGKSENSIISDFSSNQFNHVILCVPQAKDSIWLECTSQTVEPGYMGAFTGNRYALLIDENNATLVKTPAYSASDNFQVRNIKATLSDDAILDAEVFTKYAGMQQDDLDGRIHSFSQEQLKEYMRTRFSLSSYQVDNFSHTKNNVALPAIEEKIKIKVKDFATITGKRLFINPNVLCVSSFKIKDAENRKFDFDITFPFVDTDTVHINIPAGYKPESLPPNMNIELPYAAYKSTIEVLPGKIIYTRMFRQVAVRVPASKTKELAGFFDKIYKADHARIVLVKE